MDLDELYRENEEVDNRQSRAMPRPINPHFILDNGVKVGFSLRFKEIHPKFGAVWSVIIEGEVYALMDRIVAVDADEWPDNCGLNLPTAPPGIDNDAWVTRLMANSPKLQRAMTSTGFRKRENDEH